VKRLREKLNSRRGAALLLALLFFLVCMMAAASVLMAAASNGGRLRSNYDEQQKYLALSSALRLVSGQIEKAEYTGDYTVYEWEVPVLDDKGHEIYKVKYFQVCQEEGSFKCGDLTDTSANTPLDFQNELDGLYAKEFTDTGRKALEGVSPAFPAKRTLTVTVGNEADPIREKFPLVDVEAEMDAGRRIHLTATLTEAEPDPAGGDPGKVYQLEAELSAEGSPAVEYSPEDRIPGTTPAADAAKRKRADIVTGPTGPDVTWKLEWIDREEAGG